MKSKEKKIFYHKDEVTIGYYDKFFLDGGLENVFKEWEDFDPDCGPLFSYYLKEENNASKNI